MAAVRAKTTVCVGSGMCAFISDKYFHVGNHPAVVEVLREDLDEADRPAVEEAVTSCPTQALSIQEE
jgi:ferredoxin